MLDFKRLLAVGAIGLVIAAPHSSIASGLREPHMRIADPAPTGQPNQVAVTLDACSGKTDWRILGALVAHKIPTTIFATAKWMRANPKALAVMVAHPDLFEIEDHGAEHIPAVIGNERPYGIKPAGTAEAVRAEVKGGADAIAAATGHRPVWYRDATALYSPDAMRLIESDGYKIAGFSLNGDIGASVSGPSARKRIGKAKSGDVIISHINQPGRPAGAGVAAGLLDLQARGFHFVLLRDVGTFAQK